MEWVITRKGQIPRGRIPVEGVSSLYQQRVPSINVTEPRMLVVIQGYEADGRPLYHACFEIKGQFVPGKTGVHLVSDSLSLFKVPVT